MVSSISFIYLIGILQGIILVPVIYFRRANRAANRFLALLLLIFMLVLVDAYFTRINLYLKFPHLLLLIIPFLFLVGPAIYFHTAFLTHKQEKFRKKDLLHFLPAALSFFAFLPFYLKPGYEKIVDIANFSGLINITQFLHAGQYLIYMYFTFLILRRYRQRIADIFSQIDQINLNWLKILLIFSTILFVIYFLELLAQVFLNWDTLYSYYFITFIVYLIGYWSMRQYPIALLPVSAAEENHQKPGAQTCRNRFEDGTIENKLKFLQEFIIKKKPFLEPSLTLNELAEQLSLTPHNLSYIINSRLQKNFYHFINYYRVEEVKRMLSNSGKKDEDLLSIAFTAGFNTKATFNTIFKNYTGLTPSEYRRRNSEMISSNS